jgi:hypothetical protein
MGEDGVAADADDAADESADDTGSAPRGGGRDVVVPMSVYKTVTVFSTLFAVVFVLAGFVILDNATDRATAALAEVDPLLAILGLTSILAGAAIYAFSTRFRAEGMGKPKADSDESSDND